jgi:hypothetical protein
MLASYSLAQQSMNAMIEQVMAMARTPDTSRAVRGSDGLSACTLTGVALKTSVDEARRNTGWCVLTGALGLPFAPTAVLGAWLPGEGDGR